MLISEIPAVVARELGVRPAQVEATARLLDEGNTVPFIARYRKEATGELDEENIRAIEERMKYLRNFIKRQEEILASIVAASGSRPRSRAIWALVRFFGRKGR